MTEQLVVHRYEQPDDKGLSWPRIVGIAFAVLFVLMPFAATVSYALVTLGMLSAWVLGLAEDVLYGTLLGQNALILSLIIFLVLSLHQRLRMFPIWQQCLVLLVVFGLAQLVQLWISALTGNRPPTLVFLLPALISALLWPWVYTLLRALRLRLNIN